VRREWLATPGPQDRPECRALICGPSPDTTRYKAMDHPPDAPLLLDRPTGTSRGGTTSAKIATKASTKAAP
jgi:hypothetical protein